MTITEIKTAVNAGKKVQWCNSAYRVIKDKHERYLIHCELNDCVIGLTNKAGDKLNGAECEFSIV